jgi:hypothetical protein
MDNMATMNAAGKPVAKVIPIESGCAHPISGLKGKIRIHGDVFSTGSEMGRR